MMAGYLFARAGVETVVLEKHADFLRDFRGDTVHPSTLRIMHELGLLDEFLRRPHQKISRLGGRFGKAKIRLADFSGLDPKWAFTVLMPQWDFLNFLAEKGRRYPNLRVMMQTVARDLIEENGVIVGVRAETAEGPWEIRAGLVIGADGRHSIVRSKAGLPVQDLGAPIDVLWFRVGRTPDNFDRTFFNVQPGKVVITLDRGDYWQCAFVIPKGSIEQVKSRGLPAFREEAAQAAPALRDHMDDIKSWDDVKLLTVSVDRLTQWSRPGLVCLGDSAHAMSPVGGVGINLAIQDAVAAANILAAKLKRGALGARDLDAVRRRRLWPTRVTQMLQVQIQNRVLHPVISGSNADLKVPVFFRLLTHLPPLRQLTGRVMGLGVRPEHVRSPGA
jgi:2-polyprenyl-6-methoxyphenol hydroxylase-like FAD-dependent oxidoreductase